MSSQSSIRSRTWATRPGWTERSARVPGVAKRRRRRRLRRHAAGAGAQPRHGRSWAGAADLRRQHRTASTTRRTRCPWSRAAWPDPDRMDEMDMSSGAAAQYGLHLGSTLRVAIFTTAQVGSSNFTGYPQNKPYLIVPFKLVGIIEAPTGRRGRRRRTGQPADGRHPRPDQAARGVLRLLLLLDMLHPRQPRPARRPLSPPSTRSSPSSGLRRDSNLGAVRGESRTGHPARGHRHRGSSVSSRRWPPW